jgi:hypothetical protein
VFNIANQHIDFAWFTVNPPSGYLHDCSYCFAREIAKNSPKFLPAGFESIFHESG